MTSDNLKQILSRGGGRRILCIGDLMLDRYVYGETGRISPEAPVPVLNRSRSATMPGGAANVALNLVALGADVISVGVCGDDEDGEVLTGLLSEESGLESRIYRSAERRTTTKTRFVAAGQQVLRVDDEDRHELTPDEQTWLIEALQGVTAQLDAVVVSDYAKGAVTGDVMAAVRTLAANHDAPVIVDPKGNDFSRYGPVALIKPNAAELKAATGHATGSDAEVEAALTAALEQCEVGTMLVTRGGAGLSYRQRGGDIEHVRAAVRDVFDVSGAGDTSLAALAVALAGGSDLSEATALAITAASIAVGRSGTVAVSATDILRDGSVGLLDLDGAKRQIEAWRADGLRVGFTNGCFDMLHRGHVALLKATKARCDRLIVGLNSDASVTRLKGTPRPVNTMSDRAEVLLGLGAVDAVVGFEDDTPAALIAGLVPDLLAKGGDYTIEQIVGADLVLQNGGDVFIAPFLAGYSTTSMIER